MIIDSHTHSWFSHDSKTSPEAIVKAALELGMQYLAFTDHCDRDCVVAQLDWTQIDLAQYTASISALQKKYKDAPLYIALGIEVGYDKRAVAHYLADFAKYQFDVIINSIHLVDLADIYRKEYFIGKDKALAYSLYLEAVLESLDTPYDYDIVGHLGYISRNAPYEDRSMPYADFSKLIDKILLKIIELDKSLEVNSAVKTLPLLHLPDTDILKRYRQLGGDNITFGSDAHQQERLAQNYQPICEQLKVLGFTHFTIYKQREPYKIAIP